MVFIFLLICWAISVNIFSLSVLTEFSATTTVNDKLLKTIIVNLMTPEEGRIKIKEKLIKQEPQVGLSSIHSIIRGESTYKTHIHK